MPFCYHECAVTTWTKNQERCCLNMNWVYFLLDLHKENITATLKCRTVYQSILAVNISPGVTPRDLHVLLARPPEFSPKTFCVGDRGLDQLKFFQKLMKIYSVFLFLVKAFKNGWKNACFRSQ